MKEFILISLIGVAAGLMLFNKISSSHYEVSCKSAGNVVVYSGMASNCWSNEVHGYVNVE